MARQFSGQLAAADLLARRFVWAQTEESRKLGYPRLAAFAKEIARGTVSLAPTPEDPELEIVGRFLWGRDDIERRVVMSHYDPGAGLTQKIKAIRLGITARRFDRVLTRVLSDLGAGVLAA